jgi:hypothetical protein
MQSGNRISTRQMRTRLRGSTMLKQKDEIMMRIPFNRIMT